jgi:hypothetical protein
MRLAETWAAFFYSSRSLAPGEACDPRLAGLLARWEAARAGRPWPRRRDLLPETMPTLLGAVCLYDVEPHPLRFRFRVMGTQIADSHRRDLTGRYVDDIQPAEYAALLRSDLAEAVTEVRATLRRISFRSARGQRDYARLALPLSRDGLRLDAVLTASAVAGDVPDGRNPLLALPEL